MESNDAISPTSSLDSETINKPINLDMHHDRLLDLENEDQDEDQMDQFNDIDDDQDQMLAKQEMIYNPGAEASKSSITAYELYRFMEWVISAILGLLLTVWAFVPEEVLESKLGIIQFPNRYYILAVGNFIGITFLYVTTMIWGTAMI